ncbi:DUF5808 domain-containing protein [Flavobacterium sp.]|jgi:uncharacterized membrane protein|uniref:DUF5808 domain-containing protein n=1 Tax=Flavobacterium sp. TaxID=239 RepID=UPI003BDEE400
MEKPTKETLENWKNDDKYWIWGSIYYNPEDQRILPPKRIAWMGWTVNFANKKSLLVFVAILIIIVTLTIFLPHNKYRL